MPNNNVRTVRRPNIFQILFGTLKFIAFWIGVIIQVPIIFLLPRGRASVWFMRVFMQILLWLAGIRVTVHGRISSHRPLLVVCNHMSLFEIATFPVAFGGSFVAKADVRNWPLVGWISEKFGVVFVDRRPSHALEALTAVQERVKSVKYPMFLFPEGTTTNGAYVKPFKSTLFNFVENSDVAVQPMAVHYRFRDGTPISDEDLANHYAYFDNKKIDMGPRAARERSAFMQVFHIMIIGGFRVEITIMPPPPLAGMDRKQIAETLHKMVSDKYMELKNQKTKK